MLQLEAHKCIIAEHGPLWPSLVLKRYSALLSCTSCSPDSLLHEADRVNDLVESIGQKPLLHAALRTALVGGLGCIAAYLATGIIGIVSLKVLAQVSTVKLVLASSFTSFCFAIGMS